MCICVPARAYVSISHDYPGYKHYHYYYYIVNQRYLIVVSILISVINNVITISDIEAPTCKTFSALNPKGKTFSVLNPTDKMLISRCQNIAE